MTAGDGGKGLEQHADILVVGHAAEIEENETFETEPAAQGGAVFGGERMEDAGVDAVGDDKHACWIGPAVQESPPGPLRGGDEQDVGFAVPLREGTGVSDVGDGETAVFGGHEDAGADARDGVETMGIIDAEDGVGDFAGAGCGNFAQGSFGVRIP